MATSKPPVTAGRSGTFGNNPVAIGTMPVVMAGTVIGTGLYEPFLLRP